MKAWGKNNPKYTAKDYWPEKLTERFKGRKETRNIPEDEHKFDKNLAKIHENNMQVKGNTRESTNHDKSRIIKKIIGEQEQACKDFKKQLTSHTNRALKKSKKKQTW